jgi:GntR family transcriptional regulator
MTADEIADDLADRIQAGEYKPGSRLPTYRDLMDLYDVGYTTIYNVVVRLRARGLVRGAQGRGVYVVDRLP